MSGYSTLDGLLVLENVVLLVGLLLRLILGNGRGLDLLGSSLLLGGGGGDRGALGLLDWGRVDLLVGTLVGGGGGGLLALGSTGGLGRGRSVLEVPAHLLLDGTPELMEVSGGDQSSYLGTCGVGKVVLPNVGSRARVFHANLGGQLLVVNLRN